MVVADLASRFCLQERQRHQAFAKADTEGESHRILIYAAPEIIGRGGVDFRIVGSTGLKGNLAARCWLWSTAAVWFPWLLWWYMEIFIHRKPLRSCHSPPGLLKQKLRKSNEKRT